MLDIIFQRDLDGHTSLLKSMHNEHWTDEKHIFLIIDVDWGGPIVVLWKSEIVSVDLLFLKLLRSVCLLDDLLASLYVF